MPRPPVVIERLALEAAERVLGPGAGLAIDVMWQHPLSPMIVCVSWPESFQPYEQDRARAVKACVALSLAMNDVEGAKVEIC